jgi:hypothetical protein
LTEYYIRTHVTQLTIAHAAVAGFFGMNLISGLEETSGVFEMVVLSSCLFGGGFMGACVSFLEGSK